MSAVGLLICALILKHSELIFVVNCECSGFVLERVPPFAKPVKVVWINFGPKLNKFVAKNEVYPLGIKNWGF